MHKKLKHMQTTNKTNLILSQENVIQKSRSQPKLIWVVDLGSHPKFHVGRSLDLSADPSKGECAREAGTLRIWPFQAVPQCTPSVTFGTERLQRFLALRRPASHALQSFCRRLHFSLFLHSLHAFLG